MKLDWTRRFAVILLLMAVGCSPEKPTSPQDQQTHSSHELKISQESDRSSPPRNARLPSTIKTAQSGRPARETDWFEDVTSESGVSFHYDDGSSSGKYQLIESVGGGVALFDYDLDDDLDLFVTGGGTITGSDELTISGIRCALFRNNGSLQFEDVTEEVGLTDATYFTHGVAAGDIDNDGDPDLFVAGYGGCKLFRNDRTHFTDVSEGSGIDASGWNTCGAFADYNGDGLLDLYVLTYAQWKPDPKRKCINDQRIRDVCPPTHFEGELDHLYVNLGDGQFSDVTTDVGLGPGNRGLGIVAADFNNDNLIDFYAANDVQDNQLYLNSSSGKFSSEGVLMGVAVSSDGQRQGSMGATATDFDRDGALDLFYANYATEDNSLLKNTNHGFIDVTGAFALSGRSRPWVGFGAKFADLNNDGWQDLVISNGHVAYERKDSPYLQPAQLFENIEGKSFVEQTEQAGPYFSVPHAGRGLASGDLDNDGDIDLVVVHQNEPVTLLRNKHQPKHWLRLSVRGKSGTASPPGTSVVLEGQSPLQKQWIVGGGSYLSHSDRRILFPLKNSDPAEVVITWPDGSQERFSNLLPNSTHEIVQTKGQANAK